MDHTGGGRILLLSPFREPARSFYFDLMSTVASQLRATVDQLLTDRSPPDLVTCLFQAVSRADIVVAALDHGRPNVAFEVGFAQALGHRPICLARSSAGLTAFVPDESIVLHRGDAQIAIKRLSTLIPERLEERRQARMGLLQLPLADALDETIVETLARTVHQHWLDRRVSEGWSYGEKRDAASMTHPSIIGYDDLSEAERQYDRQTALVTLQTMIALGYRLEKAV